MLKGWRCPLHRHCERPFGGREAIQSRCARILDVSGFLHAARTRGGWMALSPSAPRNDDGKLRAALSTSLLLLPVLMLALLSGAAQAAPADAREEARLNNCPPKKVEVVSHTLGEAGQTLYRVECALPKIKESEGANAAGAPDAVLIQCSGAICALLRPVKTAK